MVACTELQSDRLAASAGEPSTPRIVPFFRQYFLLGPEARNQVKGLINPVPDPQHPFLGVHLTKRIDGEMMLGPNAFISFGRESYSWKDINVRDVLDYALFPGFWNFARKTCRLLCVRSRRSSASASSSARQCVSSPRSRVRPSFPACGVSAPRR